MFVRVKTTPNSPRKSVQLVEGVREGGKVRQRIVRHIGVASDEAELARLKELGEFLKAREAHDRQPGLFPPEQVAEEAIEAGRRAAESADSPSLPVDLRDLREEKRMVTGIHEAYGRVYQELGLDRLLTSRHRASRRALFHTVMARIANPQSKRGSVRRLGREFGVGLPLEKVYRMMDQLDERVIGKLRAKVAAAAGALLPAPLDVLFFDCATLYFESTTADEGGDALRQFGFSKDGKPQRTQVVLALMVTREGLPVGYEVFPGAAYEGRTFLPMMEEMRRRRAGLEAVCVADAGMFGEENLAGLESAGHRYIVGARLRSLPRALQDRIVETGRYRGAAAMEAGGKVGVFRHRGRRVVVAYSPKRAAKDKKDRQKAIKRLLDKLNRNGKPKSLLPRGVGRFLRMRGEGGTRENWTVWGNAVSAHAGRRPLGNRSGSDRRGGALGWIARRGHQCARHVRGRTLAALPRPVAGGARLPRHQTRSESAADPPLDPAPRPRPSRHRLHGFRLRAASGVPGKTAEKAVAVAGSDPRGLAGPPMLDPQGSTRGQTLCRPFGRHRRGGLDL